MNDYERVCKERLSGCTLATEKDKPETCEMCTEGLLNAIKNLGIRDKIEIGEKSVLCKLYKNTEPR